MDRGESALSTVRNWLRSVYHVEQPPTARFRCPGVPSRQSAHFGFVPSSWQRGQCRPAIAAGSFALRLKNAAFRASPLSVASDAAVAATCSPSPIPALFGSRIALKINHLREATRIINLRGHPCDASCQKSPPDASQNLKPPPQPIEKEDLTTSRLTTPHTRTDASPGWGASPARGSRSPVC